MPEHPHVEIVRQGHNAVNNGDTGLAQDIVNQSIKTVAEAKLPAG